MRRELPVGSFFNPPHATLTVGYEQAPNTPDEPVRTWFSDVIAFLDAHL